MKRVVRRSRGSLVGAAQLLAVAVSGCDPVGLGRSNPDFLVVGHRGAPNLAAENTIPSYRAALSVGANAIELDLCRTEDGVLVAFHDADPDGAVAVARQAGGEGLAWLPFVPPLSSSWRRPTRALTLSELREHYGYRRADGGRDTSAEIPTLVQVLDWARTEPRLRALYFDLKFEPSEVDVGVQALQELWDAQQQDAALAAVRFYLLTIHGRMVDALEEERAALGATAIRTVWDYEQPGAMEASLGKGLRDLSVGLTPSFTWHAYKLEIARIVRAREDGEIDTVLSWTFDREMQIAELLYYSVDGVLTNEPATLSRMWQDTLD